MEVHWCPRNGTHTHVYGHIHQAYTHTHTHTHMHTCSLSWVEHPWGEICRLPHTLIKSSPTENILNCQDCFSTEIRNRWSFLQSNYRKNSRMGKCWYSLSLSLSRQLVKIWWNLERKLDAFCWLFGFYGISTFVGYLTSNLFHTNNQFYINQFNLAGVHSLLVQNISISSYSVSSNSSSSKTSV